MVDRRIARFGGRSAQRNAQWKREDGKCGSTAFFGHGIYGLQRFFFGPSQRAILPHRIARPSLSAWRFETRRTRRSTMTPQRSVLDSSQGPACRQDRREPGSKNAMLRGPFVVLGDLRVSNFGFEVVRVVEPQGRGTGTGTGRGQESSCQPNQITPASEISDNTNAMTASGRSSAGFMQ